MDSIVNRYRERLRQLESNHRTTKRLGVEVEEVLVKKGRQTFLRVVERTTISTSDNNNQDPTISTNNNQDTTTNTSNNNNPDTTTSNNNNQDPSNATTHNNNNDSHDSNSTQETPGCFTYPKQRGYTVSPQDMQRWQEGRLLNDTLINVALAWAYRTIVSDQWKPLVRIVDSLWFTQLAKGVGPHNPNAKEVLESNSQRLRRWFPLGHPFDRPLTVVPVCGEAHWFLLALLDTGEEVAVYLMDSLPTTRGAQARSTLRMAVEMFRPELRWVEKGAPVPQQNNGVDCGCHLIHNAIKWLTTVTRNPEGHHETVAKAVGTGPGPISREVWRAIFSGIQSNEPPQADIISEWIPITPDNTDVVLGVDMNTDAPRTVFTIAPGQELEWGSKITITNKTSQPLDLNEENEKTLRNEWGKAVTKLGENRNGRLCSRVIADGMKLQIRIGRSEKGSIILIN